MSKNCCTFVPDFKKGIYHIVSTYKTKQTMANQKKKYCVNVHYDYYASVEVIAESQEEALTKAKEIADNLPMEKMECCDYTDSCVTSVEDID